MDLSLSLILELSALGIGAGFLAGLLGIGGGMVMVPFLTFMLDLRGIDPSLTIKMAIATSMTTIIFTSASSVRAHHRKGAVLWTVVKTFAPGLVLGSLLASLGVFSLVKGKYLSIVFALFVGYAATNMFFSKKAAGEKPMPGVAGQMAMGTVIGFFSGLVGAGGAFLSVPFLSKRVPIHSAVATSAAIGFPIALTNGVGYVISGWGHSVVPGALGFVWLPAVAIICAFSIFMAPRGAAMAHRWPVQKLKRAFAILLYFVAISMLVKGITA
jgi:uncharacterized membrane protein YfcA